MNDLNNLIITFVFFFLKISADKVNKTVKAVY